MRTAAALLAFAALAGCATARQPFGAPRGPQATWSVQVSAAAGAALVQAAPAGHETLRVACRRNPQDLHVAAAGLPRTPGPVVLQVGERSFPLSGEAQGPSLAAAGPWPDALPAALMSGANIRLGLGDRSWAFAPPDARTAAAFAIACRGRAG